MNSAKSMKIVWFELKHFCKRYKRNKKIEKEKVGKKRK
jgi:hypothetical protein